MKGLTQNGIALLGSVALAACSSGQSAGGNAQNEVTATNAVNATGEASSNPFADAEKQMNDRMMAAVGSDVGQNWAVKMIEHHQGAIDMSRIVLKQNPTADVARMAQEAIDKNGKDIASIRKLVKQGAPDQTSADLYRPSTMDMKQKMMAAGGSDVSQVFMRKMLEHHKGAVAMSDVALKNGVSGALRSQIETTRSANQKDADMVEAMLSGKPMSRAGSAVPKATDHSDMDGMNMSGNMSDMDMNGVAQK